MKSEISNLQLTHQFRHTKDIIRAAENGELSDKMTITVHPQRCLPREISFAISLGPAP